MSSAPKTMQVARSVARRRVLAAVIRRGGVGLAIGCGAGLALVVAGKAGWAGWSWAWAAVVPAGAGAILGGAAGLVGRWSLHAAAQRADQVLGLHDCLSNALAFDRAEPGAAERLAIRDAEQTASGVAVSRVVPVRFGSAWAAWPVLLAGALACGVWAPEREPRAAEVAQREDGEPARRAAAASIANAAADARRSVEQSLSDRAGADEIARMEEIERELLDGARRPSEALAEGARELASLAERVEREAETEALADQATREALADRVETGEDVSELARSLAEGDLERARDAASELLNGLDRMTPEDRQRYADELQRLAEQLESRGNPGEAADPGPAADPLDETLREQGIDDPETLGGSDDPRDVAEQLERRGLDPEVAQELGERLAERERQRDAERRSEEQLQDLSRAAREASDGLREPTPPAEPQDSPDAAPRDPESPETEQTGAPGERPDGPPEPGDEQTPGSEEPRGQRQPDGQEQPGEQRDGRSEGRGQGQPGKQPDARPGGAEGAEGPEGQDGPREGEAERPQGQQGEQRSGEPAQSPEGEQPGQEQRGDGPPAGQQPGEPAGEQQAPGERSPTLQDGAEPGGPPDGGQPREGVGEDLAERPTDGRGDAPDRQAMERLKRELDRMAERGRGAAEGRRDAERLREQAERMLEQASPEERREIERLARELATDAGGDQAGGTGATDRPDRPGPRPTPDRGWESEPFDARGQAEQADPGGGQVIADWYGGDDARPGGPATGPSSGGPALQEAARGAERAIERRAVPRARQELIRRVFERYRQRAAEGGAADGGGDDS